MQKISACGGCNIKISDWIPHPPAILSNMRMVPYRHMDDHTSVFLPFQVGILKIQVGFFKDFQVGILKFQILR